MKSEPVVIITCDGCSEEIEASLTALADGSYDERGLDKQIERTGWISRGDEHLCSDCRADEE